MYYKLLYLFSDLKDSEFTLQDDGQGPYISQWNRPDPQPTQAELDAVTPAQEQASKDSSPNEIARKARERLQTRGVGVILREEFNDLLEALGL